MGFILFFRNEAYKSHELWRMIRYEKIEKVWEMKTYRPKCHGCCNPSFRHRHGDRSHATADLLMTHSVDREHLPVTIIELAHLIIWCCEYIVCWRTFLSSDCWHSLNFPKWIKTKKEKNCGMRNDGTRNNNNNNKINNESQFVRLCYEQTKMILFELRIFIKMVWGEIPVRAEINFNSMRNV